MTKLDQAFLPFGILAAATFTMNWIILGLLLPGYDPISQTISELGESGSAFERTFRIVMLSEAGFMAFFGYAVLRYSTTVNYSVIPGISLVFLAVCQTGIFVFESPHPLHNFFGIASIAGLLSPLALFLSWNGHPHAATLRMISGFAALLLAFEIALNLSPLFIDFTPSDLIRTHYGAIQRSLYITFYAWIIYLAAQLITGSKLSVVA